MELDKERSDHDQQITTEKIKVFDTTGLRVLVVDDDGTCLQIAGIMLKTCKYEVTACKTAREAMSILREDKNRFDIVLTDLHMPDMNGVSLLEFIGLEMDLPVVIMSQSDTKEDIIDGIAHGACDYLVKPITMEAIKMLWKHVITRKVKYCSRLTTAKPAVNDEGEIVLEGSNPKELFVIPHDHICKEKTSMKRKIEDGEDGYESLDVRGKKRRFVWSRELHQKFMAAVEELGYLRAVPKTILEVMTRMNVPNITREKIASHLQKYRLYIQKHHIRSSKENSFMEAANKTPLQNIPSMDMLNINRASRQSNSNPFVNLQKNVVGINYHPGSTSSQPHNPFRTPINIESDILYPANINQLSNLFSPNSEVQNNILANNHFGAVPWPTPNPVPGTGTGMSSVTHRFAESSTTRVVPVPSNYGLNRNIGFSNDQFSNLPIIQRGNSIEGIFGRNGYARPINADYSSTHFFDQIEMLEKNNIPELFSFPVIENVPGSIMRTRSGEDFNMLAWNQQQGENSNITHQVTLTGGISTEHEKDAEMPQDLSFDTLLQPKNPEQRDAKP